MDRFETLTGIAASLPFENINTDGIIPVRWIVSYGKDLGQGLFGGWRYGPDGSLNPEFILNQAPFRDAKVLLAGRNFGCGSSREEAIWALMGFGIRCVIAPSFGDIFFENAFKNRLLPIIMQAEDIAKFTDDPLFSSKPLLSVDLKDCKVSVPGSKTQVAFSIEEGRRKALIMGLDHIDVALAYSAEIDDFQKRDRGRRPWVYTARELSQ